MTSASVTTATGGGAVTDDGGTTVTSRGLVWNTTGNPSLFSYIGITIDGTGEGSFSSTLNNLNCGTTYYVKAYATNSVGTAYSDTEVSFTTNGTSLVSVNLFYTFNNKTWYAPAYVPNILYINSSESQDTACVYAAVPYHSGGSFTTYKVEIPFQIGSQLYVNNPNNPCQKSYITAYYMWMTVPKTKVIVTNGIVTYMESCE